MSISDDHKNDTDPAERLKYYGRRKGHTLSGRKQSLVETLLPAISVDIDGVEEGALDPKSLFTAPPKEVWLEVGFGKGEHMVWQTEHNNDIGMIGCEPYLNGVAGLLSQIDDTKNDAIRIFGEDARYLLELLPDASITKVFLLHPDPWPKRRHAKRRFLCPDNLDQIARLLVDGGEFRVAHDLPVYQEWISLQMSERDDFVWQAKGRSDWIDRAEDWPETRYEAKAKREGRTPMYFRYRRAAR